MDEDALLALIVPRLPVGEATLLGPGDDAALVATPDGRVVVSADVLVEGSHFRREWSTGADVGWRAAWQNLADIAAMGATPTALVVTVVLPPDLPATWAVDLADGLAQACAVAGGVGVVGGDLSAGALASVSVTVLGDLGGRQPVRRSGARPGDVLAHAGPLGRSAAGLALLTAGQGAAHPALVQAYLRPTSPLAAGPAAADAGAVAMLDVSDGLARDAARIAVASGVRVDLDRAALDPDVHALAGAAALLGADPLGWVLTGGEDHGLLAAFPPGVGLPAPFRPVGRVQAGDPGLTVDGAPLAGRLGYDHFG